MELLDTLIIALGCTTILAAFLVKPAMASISGSTFQVFLTIFYPVGDIVILVSVLTLISVQSLSMRNILLILGATTYTATDLYFLYLSQSGNYQFGSLSDIGWLASFILFSESFWHSSNEKLSGRSFNRTSGQFDNIGDLSSPTHILSSLPDCSCLCNDCSLVSTYGGCHQRCAQYK
jgi:hypothetical protein